MRSIQVYLPPQNADWLKEALRLLADAVIPDEEAGQRGAKISKLVQMIACAYIADVDETTRLMREIRGLLA